MSKIYDVEKMYGQDFSIVTTNAPSNIIKQTTKLLSNTLLISSPKNEKEDSDNNMPAMFVTDYDGQSLQLTYPFCMINGLNCHENGYLYINIDNSTIKTEYSEGKGKLTVDTNNLSNAGFNKKGVVKLSNTLTGINRNLTQNYGIEQSISDKYDDSTFISINNEGTLYLNNDFLTLVNSIVDLKIKQKLDSIKVMLNNNLKMWINITNVSGNSTTETINVNESTYSIESDKPTTLTFDLYFLSFNDEPEKINIEDKTDKIYRIEFEDDLHLTTVTQFQDNEELYQHCLKNITLTFLPNFFIENNESYKQNIELSINVGNDQSQKLTFQQEKIDNTIDISLSDNELSVNEIVNKVDTDTYKITETINFGSFKNVTLNGKDVINYKIHTFIANNVNNNNYELFDIDNYQIKDNDNDNKIVFESMSNNTETRLYAFISSIIDKDKLSENEDDKYYINVDNNHSIIINSNNDKENIDNYIDVEYVNQEKEYSLNLGTNIIISTDNNLNLGTFTRVIPIKLNINRKTLYGYIYITSTDISANINNKPACIYYKTNYNDIDYKGVNNEYNGQNINTTKLIGIWENINTNSLDSNNNILLNIKYTDFKTYNAIDNADDSKITDINSIYFEHNNYIYTTNNYTSNNSSNNILSIGLLNPESIIQMLYNGLSLKIKYDNNKDLSLIKSQTFYMYINMLNSVLNKIKFNDNEINTTSSTNDKNSPKYYSMNRYIISNDNNNIDNIKISLPDYIKYLLKNDINTSFIITFVFYKFINGEPKIVNYELEFKFSGETINVYSNDSTNQNNFIIDSSHKDDKDNPYFELKSYNNSLLPKLLMISCNIKGKESKFSYVKDTYRCNGGNLIDNSGNNYISQKLLHSEDSSVLYDIVFVPNSTESSIKDVIGGISNIQISNLDLSGKNIIFNNGKTITDTDFNSNFALLINDNNKQYHEAKLGSLYKTNFEFNYLINPDNILNDYNLYSSTPIDGSKKIIDTGYKIRFSEVILNQKESTNNIDNIFIDLENSIKYIICWNTSISFEYLYDNILSQIYNIKINNNINNLNHQNVTLCTITNGNISKATELSNDFDYKLCINKLQLPYSDNNVNITNLLFNETFRFKDITWYGGYFGPTKQELNKNDYTYNIIINLNNNESQQFTWHNINLADIDIQLELIQIYIENVIDNATGTPKNLIDDPNYSYESEILSLSEITLDYLTELSKIYDNNININQQFIFQVHVKYDNIKTVEIDKYIYINWGTTIINPLSSGDIYFYNNSDENNPHTHINSFIFNNTTYNNEIKLHYDNTKISSVTIKLQDNSNNTIVTSNKPIVITEGTNEYTFTLSSNYTNNTQYNIICEAKGKTEGERYHDQTIICTVGIMFNQSLIDSNLFNWNTTDTTINYNYTSDPNDLNNQLPTLTNTTGKSVAYTIQYQGDTTNNNYPIIDNDGNDRLNCIDGQKNIKIDISNVASSEDNQTFTYKIIATIQGYDNYVTTSRETFITLVIPGTNTSGDSNEGNSNEGGESGTSGNNGNDGE